MTSLSWHWDRITMATAAHICIGLILLGSSFAQEKKKGLSETPSSVIVDVEEETSTPPNLTGDPQKDYIHDPNLPHELIGYDLSNYPFYKRVPKEGHNFTCDGRHDGFYASVPHQCQVYYNCLFGQRYDFLCANYTVFDQVNFICHYASEVDCKSSARYFDRNEDLYQTTTTTTPAPPKIVYVDRPRPRPLRPLNSRRPAFRRPRPNRPQRQRVREDEPQDSNLNNQDYNNQDPQYYDYYDTLYDDYYYDDVQPVATTTTTTTTQRPLRRRIRPGTGGRGGGLRGGGTGLRGGGGGRRRGEGGGRRRLRQGAGGGNGGGRRRRIKTTTTTTTASPDEYEYYYDDYYYYDDPPAEEQPKARTEAPAPPRTPEPATPRSRPGQIRRPNFKRSQSVSKDAEVVPTEAPSVVESAVDEPAVRENLNEEEPANNNRRQFNRRPNTSSQLVSRPVNSRGNVVQNEPETSNSDNLPGRRRRIQTQRQNAAPNLENNNNEEEESPVPPRRVGSGFGGRRPRS